MAKTTAPLLSFSASGQIAKTQVYASWKGRQYVRRHVVPSNPQSLEQDKTRQPFSWLQSVYKLAPSLLTEPWEAYAKGKVLTARNAFTKFNLPTLRPVAVVTNATFSPGALGGLPPTASVATGGSGTASMAVAVPAVLPTGWSIVSAVCALVRQQDSHGGALFTTYAVEDTTSPYVCAFSGLGAGVYVVGTWLKWLRPDGQTAYSPSIQGTVTVT